jgi:rubrerythrin
MANDERKAAELYSYTDPDMTNRPITNFLMHETLWRDERVMLEASRLRSGYYYRNGVSEFCAATLWFCTACGWGGDQAEDNPCPNCGGTDWSGVRRA